MKQRYLICFLLSGAMLLYGYEYLPLNGSGMDQIFAWAWIAFAVIVISGNGLHLLYRKNQESRNYVSTRRKEQTKARLRG
jgi:hypothetical protein